MAYHILLTSKAQTLPSIKIARLSDDEAFSLLCEPLWGSKEVVFSLNAVFSIKPTLSLLASNGCANIVNTRLALHQGQFLLITSCRFKPTCSLLRYF